MASCSSHGTYTQKTSHGHFLGPGVEICTKCGQVTGNKSNVTPKHLPKKFKSK